MNSSGALISRSTPLSVKEAGCRLAKNRSKSFCGKAARIRFFGADREGVEAMACPLLIKSRSTRAVSLRHRLPEAIGGDGLKMSRAKPYCKRVAIAGPGGGHSPLHTAIFASGTAPQAR